MQHKTVSLVSPFDNELVEIDAEIAPLIRWIWDGGMMTDNSCQDNFGYVWVSFASADDASEFLSTLATKAADKGDDNLRYHAVNPCDLSPHDRGRLESQYHTWPDAWLISICADVWPEEGTEVVFTVSVRFPREHLGSVMAALQSPSKAA